MRDIHQDILSVCTTTYVVILIQAVFFILLLVCGLIIMGYKNIYSKKRRNSENLETENNV
jgi:hypothetical protein